SGARQVRGNSQGFEEIVLGWTVLEVEAVAVVKRRELHLVVEALGAGRRKGGEFGAVLANALAADVDVPGKAARGGAAYDLIQRIIFVRANRQPHLDRPVAVFDPRGHLGLGIPREPLLARRAPVEITHRTARTDSDLVVRVRLRLEEHFHGVAIPQRTV